MDSNSGIIFNIQKYSLHDGPGIRTIVFLKGCPLRCPWCSNPESQYGKIQVILNIDLCIGCGSCYDVCKKRIRSENGFSKCNIACGNCVKVCPVNAMEMIGEYVTVAEVLDEVAKDRQFYRRSGGGMTLSGGEPLVQHEFAVALLKEAKTRQIHTAIETTGYANPEIARKVLTLADHILYDIKIVDDTKHRTYIGVSNQRIIENLCTIAKTKSDDIIIRVPLIGSINDDEHNMRQTAEIACKNGVKTIHLLPYHRYGEGKYQKLHQVYNFEAHTPDDEQIAQIIDMMKSYGLTAKKSG